ncbi:hypothetical protein [Rhodobacter sp. 24-YEA-8]|uniref:hypothetical protein n=1 Tax=Rhodobacter sp. 24-YEA-8 TaxID=1884310 RepID=UPI00089777ED|nr:hypothetical protein [Rhodobacter sp. 24-YEA-8]SED61324.1 hypothetical protein SAMN05519105_4274 [Rhodobacter sp. 24-YEA-8]
MAFRHRMVSALIGMAAMTWLPAAASAREDADLRVLMALLPASVFTSAEQGYVEYLGLAQLLGKDGSLSSEHLARLAWGANIRPVAALGADPALFRARSGIGLSDLRWLAGFGQAPQEISLWGFPDASAAQGAFDGLADLGFARAGLLPGVLANGDPGAMDFARSDVADPWRGPMGRTSTVTLRDAALLQAATSADFAPVLGASTTALESDAGRIALAGVEYESEGVIQALILSPLAVGAQSVDPAFLIGKTQEEAQAAFEAEVANISAGLPLYSGAILAEVVTPSGAQAVLSLAYPSCAEAEEALARAPLLWTMMNPAYVPAAARLTGQTVDAAPGCAARIVLAPAEDSEAGNLPVLRSVVTGIQFRDVAILRIGSAPAAAAAD